MRRLVACFTAVFFFVMPCFSQMQDNLSGADAGSRDTAVVQPDAFTDADSSSLEDAPVLKRGFRGVFLGDDVDTVKEKLEKDTLFFYRDSIDVSMNPDRDDIIIETKAWKYITSAHYQFYKGRLALIVLEMDTEILDYFGMYRTLSEKYGEPFFFSPSVVKWQDDSTIIVLERPLTVKYIDKKTDEEIRQGGQILKSTEDVARDAFLKEF